MSLETENHQDKNPVVPGKIDAIEFIRKNGDFVTVDPETGWALVHRTIGPSGTEGIEWWENPDGQRSFRPPSREESQG